ncbi:MAG: hypothetical protein FVQ77_01225 [Cytophagales bacterium]|nr:hypothetical protein [Cytophagales bacterium]
MATNKISSTKESVLIEVEVGIIKERNCYVAYCPALELSGYGDTTTEAKHSFETSMKIFIEETDRKGTLEKLLLKLGWSLRKSPIVNYEPPKLSYENLVIFKNSENIIKEKVRIPI